MAQLTANHQFNYPITQLPDYPILQSFTIVVPPPPRAASTMSRSTTTAATAPMAIHTGFAYQRLTCVWVTLMSIVLSGTGDGGCCCSANTVGLVIVGAVEAAAARAGAAVSANTAANATRTPRMSSPPELFSTRGWKVQRLVHGMANG